MPVSLGTSRATLATGTVYNLYTLLTDAAHVAIMSKQFISPPLPLHTRTIYLENHGGGIAYLATDSGVSTTHYYRALDSTGSNYDERIEVANAMNLSDIYIVVSANNTILGIRFDFF
jgi:hypothetical protein